MTIGEGSATAADHQQLSQIVTDNEIELDRKQS